MESFKVGEAPWEQENSTEFKVGEAPWEQNPEKIVNEMHPDIDFATRAIYKNFGADPESSFRFLQKKLPNLQLKKDKEGEVLAKRPDETEWRRLDPTGPDLQDISDIGYDVLAAVAQGAATAATGLAGGVAGGGVLAIPAAMVASGVTGAGLEGLRQGIGPMMGIEDNASKEQALLAGAAGAVSPLMFGTGAGAKEALKYAGKEGAKDLLQTQRGLLGRGYDAVAGYVGPKLANLAGGENPKVIKRAASMLEELLAADKNPEVSVLPLEEAARNVPKKLNELRKATGQKLDDLRDLIDNSANPSGLVPAGQKIKNKGSIDAKPFVQPFLDMIADLESKAAGQADKEAIEEIKKIVQKEFSGMDEFLTAAQVDSKMQKFKILAEEHGKKYKNTGSTQSTSIAGFEGRLADAFDSSRRAMNDSIVSKLEELSTGSGKEYLDTKEVYSDLLRLGEKHKNDFKDAKSLSNFLRRAMDDTTDIPAKDLETIQRFTGVDLEDLAVNSQAFKVFSKPETEIRSLARSVTPRQLALGVGTGALGYHAAQQSGGEYSPFITALMAGALGSKAASPAMIRKYMEANQLMRQAPSQVPGYKYLPYLMMNPNLQGE